MFLCDILLLSGVINDDNIYAATAASLRTTETIMSPWSACCSASACQMALKSGRPRRNTDVLLVFKMADEFKRSMETARTQRWWLVCGDGEVLAYLDINRCDLKGFGVPWHQQVWPEDDCCSAACTSCQLCKRGKQALITRSHGGVTSIVRAIPQVNGRGQNYPLTKTTPLNRQSPNIAHVITSTISAHISPRSHQGVLLPI